MNSIKSRGFTLVELMVTVAILAIVAAIAYPAYTGYTITASRSEGKIALNKIAMAQVDHVSLRYMFLIALYSMLKRLA